MRFIVIVFLLFSISCQNQVTKGKFKDDIRKEYVVISSDSSSLVLKNSIYKDNKYKLLYLKTYGENSGDKVQLLKNDSAITTLSLPISDVEVKNFSLNKFEETNKGFNFYVSWGGGNYLYQSIFYFEYKEGMFYLSKVGKRDYILKSEKEISTEEKITPPVRIDKFILSEFL
ncbi:MAG: hypothetical protein J4G05_01035 [Chlorobi bacterium]|nr:hypothetical protein [Chlorobiota bacterium]